jgi:hypothetical protein
MTDETLQPPKRVELTSKQEQLRRLIFGPATHILAYGGSRSGKTWLLVRAIVTRALRAPGSRHLIARRHFNHVIQSIWHDTFLAVMSTCFPDVTYKQDKAAWFIEFANGSQIWFGGLDDRERTEKPYRVLHDAREKRDGIMISSATQRVALLETLGRFFKRRVPAAILC